MEIISNNKVINRKTKVDLFASLIGMGVLAIGFFFAMKKEDLATNQTIAFIALIIGFIITQISVYHRNRWGKSSREDELVIKSLKGLGKQVTLYNNIAPAPYLLVGPMGIWVLIPYFHEGVITYNEKRKRWHQKSNNLFGRIFSQAGLGRPDQDVITYCGKMERYFKKNLPANLQPEVNVALIFTTKSVKIDAANAPVPTLALDKVKDFLRKLPKDGPVDPEMIAAVKELFPRESIS